ncbi:MAG: Flp family type IVb pilin [Firmicutes bacterium]|jgi:pilus assembly protein Flp/PilA|nr:Flp family type IVb pilin [Bacillota bacterium]
MLTFLKNLFEDESGQGMVEYGLILALVAVVVIVALTFMGDQIKDIFQGIGEKLGGVGGGEG